ncbi:MAG: cob(I)yrinic acid a,c-diamide adenosyltransferase [Actinobacteria bacterium]|nr:cob(I)yrinic acid a,c-diamide adenosyltransferase [Actinomycetota bacterium]
MLDGCRAAGHGSRRQVRGGSWSVAGALWPDPSGQLRPVECIRASSSIGSSVGVGCAIGPRLRLVKIYTRHGDDGTTGLLYGGRVAKDSAAPMAYGAVDEAQAAIGLARAEADAELGEILLLIERDLWVLMGELATDPSSRDRLVPGATLVSEEMVASLETTIDAISERFDPPTEFVVPGQNRIGALLDVARTVVRRAERDAMSAVVEGSIVVPYLNRLSDLLWTLARWQEGTSLPTRSVRP